MIVVDASYTLITLEAAADQERPLTHGLSFPWNFLNRHASEQRALTKQVVHLPASLADNVHLEPITDLDVSFSRGRETVRDEREHSVQREVAWDERRTVRFRLLVLEVNLDVSVCVGLPKRVLTWLSRKG